MKTRRPALVAALCFGGGIVFRSWMAVPSEGLLWAVVGLWLMGLGCLLGGRKGWSGGLFGLLMAVLGCFWCDVHTRHLPYNHYVHVLPDAGMVVASGRVVDEPEILDADRRLVLLVSQVTVGDTTWATTGRALIRFRNMDPGVDYGDVLSVQVALVRPEPARNPGGFDYRRFLARRGLHGTGMVSGAEQILHHQRGVEDGWARLVLPVRRAIRQAVDRNLSGAPAGLLKGILLGEKRAVPDAVRQAFTRCGVNHVLAVSGLHVGLIAGVFYFGLRLMGVGRGATAVVTTGAIWLYAMVTGMPPSVVRACVMGGLALCGMAGERQVDGGNALGAAGLVLLIAHPEHMLDVGFQLSFAATGGIFLFYASFKRMIPGPGGWWQTWIRAPLAVSLAAQATTLPFVVTYFGLLSTVGLAANLIVVPLMGAAVALGVLGALCWTMFEPLTTLLNGANYLVLSSAIFVAKHMAEPTWAAVTVSKPSGLFWGLYACVLVLLIPGVWRRRTGRYAVLALLVLANGYVWRGIVFRAHDLEVYVLDVGQGDAIFLKFPGGRTMLVDGGLRAGQIDMGQRVVAPFLRSQGISRIDVVVGSHPHSDHIGGLISIVEQFEVGHYLDAGQYVDAWTNRRLLEVVQARGVAYHAVAAGDSLVGLGRGGALVLHPTGRYVSSADVAPHGLNNGSVVLRVVFEGQALLLTGDIERETDGDLLRWGDRLRAQVLKSAHHGSRTSSAAAFLSGVQPEVVVISCGVNNRYGHPSGEVVTRYEEMGMRMYRTDHSGAIVLRMGRDGVRVKTWK